MCIRDSPTDINIDETLVRLSLVGYRVQVDGTATESKLALFRGAKAYTYFDKEFMGLDVTTTNNAVTGLDETTLDVASIDALDPATDYDLLSQNVFRLEIAIIDSSGALKSSVPTASIHTGGAPSADILDAAYLIVGIAVLSPEDREKLSPNEINDMAGVLDNVTNDETPFEAWADYIDGTRTLPGPPAVVNNVRYFQRAFPLSDR